MRDTHNSYPEQRIQEGDLFTEGGGDLTSPFLGINQADLMRNSRTITGVMLRLDVCNFTPVHSNRKDADKLRKMRRGVDRFLSDRPVPKCFVDRMRKGQRALGSL